MRLTIIRMTALLLALIAAQSVSADFEAGQRALDAGNMDEAVTQWQEAANAGDGRAMLELGQLYLQGLGVIQDYVEAHKWFNLAASRGVAEALAARDALAAKMTPAQVAMAQERAAAWQSGGGTQTGESSPEGASTADASQPPPQAIREAQVLLEVLGYQPGPADGVWNPGAKAAYQAFLRDAGLPQAETLTPQALRTMQSIAERQGATQTDADTAGTQTASGAPSQASATPQPQIRPDALHNAAQAGDIEMLKAAVTASVDVNARDSRGRTALMHAVDKGYPLLVSELLEAQADVNVRAPDGATALFMAAAHGHTEIIELLMKAGADVSIRGPQSKTPVDVAKAKYGEVDAARQNDEPPAVLALLDGKAWAKVEEERAREEQIAAEKALEEQIVMEFHDGKISSPTNEKSGLYEKLYENGKFVRGNHQDGKKNGAWELFYKNGQLCIIGNYQDGEKDGTWKRFSSNGELVEQGKYKNGKLHGTYKSFFDGGGLDIKASYKNGKLHGALRDYYYSSNTVSKIVNFKNGELHGTFKVFDFLDGKLDYKHSYKNGVHQYDCYHYHWEKHECFDYNIPDDPKPFE